MQAFSLKEIKTLCIPVEVQPEQTGWLAQQEQLPAGQFANGVEPYLTQRENNMKCVEMQINKKVKCICAKLNVRLHQDKNL